MKIRGKRKREEARKEKGRRRRMKRGGRGGGKGRSTRGAIKFCNNKLSMWKSR